MKHAGAACKHLHRRESSGRCGDRDVLGKSQPLLGNSWQSVYDLAFPLQISRLNQLDLAVRMTADFMLARRRLQSLVQSARLSGPGRQEPALSVSTAHARTSPRVDTVRPSPTKPPRRQRRIVVVMVSLLVAGAAFWESSHRRGTGPAAGHALSGVVSTVDPPSKVLRVATFNIHGGKGHDNLRDLGRIARDIEQADIVGLNEVEGPFLFERQPQVEQLAQKLQMAWLFAPAERRWLHYEFGNGVLSQLPVSSWERIPLPRSFGKGFRNLVLLRSSFAGKSLHVVVTHIDRSDARERAAQVRFVADYFLALPEPAILMGDLNTTADEAELRRLLDTPGGVDAQAQVEELRRHMEWILTRGLVVRDAGVRAVGASDHPALWAELELPPEK